jgi:hypothetical protein
VECQQWRSLLKDIPYTMGRAARAMPLDHILFIVLTFAVLSLASAAVCPSSTDLQSSSDTTGMSCLWMGDNNLPVVDG